MTIFIIGLIIAAVVADVLEDHVVLRGYKSSSQCPRCCGYKIELIPGTGKMIDCKKCKGTGK
jgi:transposase